MCKSGLPCLRVLSVSAKRGVSMEREQRSNVKNDFLMVASLGAFFHVLFAQAL